MLDGVDDCNCGSYTCVICNMKRITPLFNPEYVFWQIVVISFGTGELERLQALGQELHGNQESSD